MKKMVARKKSGKEKKLLKDYEKIMKAVPNFANQPHQWNGPGDTFVKFTTYKEGRTISLPYSL